MDPIFLGKILQKCIQYWYLIVIIILIIVIYCLNSVCSSKTKTIANLNTAIALHKKELSDLELKITQQNKAVDELANKGKEQAIRLDLAIQKVNQMKPATQVIIREIYTDKAKDANDLLFNALSD